MSEPRGAAQWYAIVLIQYLLINQLQSRRCPPQKIFLRSRGGTLTEEGQPAIGTFHFAEDLREIGHGAGGTFE